MSTTTITTIDTAAVPAVPTNGTTDMSADEALMSSVLDTTEPFKVDGLQRLGLRTFTFMDPNIVVRFFHMGDKVAILVPNGSHYLVAGELCSVLNMDTKYVVSHVCVTSLGNLSKLHWLFSFSSPETMLQWFRTCHETRSNATFKTNVKALFLISAKLAYPLFHVHDGSPCSICGVVLPDGYGSIVQ